MPPAETDQPKPIFAAPIRHLLGVFAALWGLAAGYFGGEWLGYAIAQWTERDIAELKDMLIWSTFGGAIAGALVFIWIVLTVVRASGEARRIAFIGASASVVLVAGLMLASFDWPKASGAPLVMFEIRLPQGSPQPRQSRVDLILWADKTGKGCYVADLRREAERPVISGSFVVVSKSETQTLSLRLDRDTESHWVMPVRTDSKPEKQFGAWQRIAFVPNPRENVPPLPPGEYEIRYRVKKYL